MRDVRVADEVRDSGHDLRDSGLVVGTEQRRAVARDQLVAHVVSELRPLVGIEHLRRVTGEGVRPAFVPEDLRLHVLARNVRRRVDVRNEPDRRCVRVAGERSVDDPASDSSASRPSPFNSSRSIRERSSCRSVEGAVGESGSDVVQTCAYRTSRSRASAPSSRARSDR